MKLKLTYLIIGISDKKPTDPDYLKFFLEENYLPPCKILDEESLDFKTEEDIIKEIHEQYINYSFGFYKVVLSGFRIIDKNLIEACYICKMKYMPGICKTGKFYSLEEIDKNNILLEEYYGELAYRNGSFIR